MNGPRGSGPPIGSAELAKLHIVIDQHVRLYWDLQHTRITVGNRAGAMCRLGIADTEGVDTVAVQMAAIEHGVVLKIRQLIRQHFMRDWIDAQKGIDLLGFAAILGVAGPLDRFSTVSKLWKYLGLHVVDGHAPKRVKGQAWTHTDCQFQHLATCPTDCTTDHHPHCVPGGVGTAYAPRGRVVAHQIAASIVKVGAGGPYRGAYDRKKAQYEAERPDWTQARRHNAAMRYAVKLLVKNLWIEWHRRMKVSTAAA